MIKPTSLEHLAELINSGKHVLFFTAKWCGDCVFIKPYLPEIMAAFPDLSFVEVDRDEYLDACIEMGVMGIPSFIIVDKGQELGRFVSKERKTKEQVIDFISPFY